MEVMFHFPEPGRGVLAALNIMDAAAEVGLPPAHVGLHAGPVLFQEGDYFGRTVNIASRIADYARPGEVVVSREVMDSAGASRCFRGDRSGRAKGSVRAHRSIPGVPPGLIRKQRLQEKPRPGANGGMECVSATL
jgi:adenylate cyclase